MEQQELPIVPAEQGLATIQPQIINATNAVAETSTFGDSQAFQHAQRVAKMLSSSSMIPDVYKGNIQNTMIALEMANRIGASPLMVMQNLAIIHGKPSWSSTFIIAAINSCKRFSPLRFVMSGEGITRSCTAVAKDLQDGEILEGPEVTWKMALDEGWVNKTGSKWKTMPELMFRYRAGAFFGRLYAPDVLMGMHTSDEVEDFTPVNTAPSIEDLEMLFDMKKEALTADELKDFKRIIDNKEEASYNKIHKILLSK